jgi:transposase
VTDGETAMIDEVVADKGYRSNQVLVDLAALDLRTYIAKPDRGRRHWKKNAAARAPVYANRRRIRSARGLALLRHRSERLERPNAHLYETGAMRRTHLRGHRNILKRLLIHVDAFNLGFFMRTLGIAGTPRRLQGRLALVFTLILATWSHVSGHRCDRRQHLPSTRPRSYRFIVLGCYSVRQNVPFNHRLLDSLWD